MARRKRASMREGPLADLFRSTIDDPPADPPEAPQPGERRTEPEREPSEAPAQPPEGAEYEPRFGREDPAEKRRHEHEEELTAETPSPPAPSPSPDPQPAPPDPEPPEPEPEPAPPQISADDPLAPPRRGADTSSVPGPKERLTRIFGDESQRRDLVENPRYGREEPSYEPRAGEPHSPVIRVVGVGGAGVNAVNRMVEAQIPGVEFMAVNTDLQSLQLCIADVTIHIGDGQTRGLGTGADPELGHKSMFDEQDKIKRLLKGSDMVFIAAG